ncbi:MAG TPA: dienelactone hydrolase family protein [Phycisphaerales bacterium]|nr:dienelactone hydrolase family protein [Phycisphaerales bacterium]HMP38607.1 dienelactone hydrolase family protein [Phycisphaerales bacterium]
MRADLSSAEAPPPHGGGPLLVLGPEPSAARGAVILLHGRGAGIEGIAGLIEPIALPDLLWLVPEAATRSWYPESFMAPAARNEIGIASAIGVIAALLDELETKGLPREQVAIMGFSQGACLACEFAWRRPARYGAIIGFTGAMISGAGPSTPLAEGEGALAGTPVLLGANDPDPHVPFDRVAQTAEALRGRGAVVELVRYPGEPHTVLPDEIVRARALLATIEHEGLRR